LNARNEGVNVNGDGKKEKWEGVRPTEIVVCVNREVIRWCAVGHRERKGAREESEEVITRSRM